MKNSKIPKSGQRQAVSGKLHIYTGDGKGKTTTALGLALRAIGSNKKVALVQFMKKPICSEHKAIKKYKLPIDVFAYGIGFYKILGDKKTEKQHEAIVQKAWKKVQGVINSKKYDLIILDEINVVIGFGLLSVDIVIDTIKTSKSEIVLTGRNAHSKLIKIADLVTEMKKKKHYFDKGVKARKGIEY
ncbi:MAG: cob(I)yrinic acid a,c-diamide adenosyltransferase [Candidatus Berkelbacteria bacterium]|nr:cob(I)yrinic acid a,c-diamide adenosyltransferase [Candidatus Berkelbacteria bacterium]